MTGITALLFSLAVQVATLDVSNDDLAAHDAPSECYRDVREAAHNEAISTVAKDGFTLEQVYTALNSMSDDVADLINQAVGQVVVNPFVTRAEDDAMADMAADMDDWPDHPDMDNSYDAPPAHYLSASIGTLLEAC